MSSLTISNMFARVGAASAALLAPVVAFAQETAPAATEAAVAAPAMTVDKGDTTWMLISAILVLLMIVPGLALFYGGLVRARAQTAAVTTISTFHAGFASGACTVARAGASPGTTQASQARFIAAPSTAADGDAFPDGKHVALTRWTADADKPTDMEKQRGNWQYCGSTSGAVVSEFINKWPNAESPEPGIM